MCFDDKNNYFQFVCIPFVEDMFLDNPNIINGPY